MLPPTNLTTSRLLWSPAPPVRRAPLLLSVLAATLVVAVPVTAIAQDLSGARDRVTSLRGELEDATVRYEETWAAVEAAKVELAELDARAEELEAEALRMEAQLEERARQVFMRGVTSSLELLLAAEGPTEAIERASLADAVQRRDQVGLEEAVAARIALEQAKALAEERRLELEALQVELDLLREQLEGQLEDAQSRVATLEALAARQRQIDRGGQRGTYACPMDRSITHFVDSWGAPRSGGRSHKGTDIMGPMGARVYAFTDGVIARHSNSRLGGISLYLRGNDGNTYFYTHLQGYAPGGSVGRRVTAGDHIAFNGNTGNARGGAPHIHFERAPGGGSPVNPYPYLAAACF
jgi:peptidoglycan LD-endopeptidase LytH